MCVLTNSSDTKPPSSKNNYFSKANRKNEETSSIKLDDELDFFKINDFDDPGEFESDRSVPLKNPFLKTRRQLTQDKVCLKIHRYIVKFFKKDICHIWNSNSVEDLCSRGRWARLKQMRELSLFSRDCSSNDANVQLGALFRIEWQSIKSERDLLAYTEQLKAGIEGRDCVLGLSRSTQCKNLYQYKLLKFKNLFRFIMLYSY